MICDGDWSDVDPTLEIGTWRYASARFPTPYGELPDVIVPNDQAYPRVGMAAVFVQPDGTTLRAYP